MKRTNTRQAIMGGYPASINAGQRRSTSHPGFETTPAEGLSRVILERTTRLRPYNLIVGIVHLLQAITLLALSNDFSLPITAAFIAGPPGSDFTPREVLWEVPLGPAVAVFLLLASIDHLLMAAPGIWPWYRDNLNRQINKARWWEYSISASIMIALIALVTGVSDVGAIAAIAGVNSAMIFFGLVMELFNRPSAPVRWTPFMLGCVAGTIPWGSDRDPGDRRRIPSGRSGRADLRIRDHRLALPPIQQFRRQHGLAV